MKTKDKNTQWLARASYKTGEVYAQYDKTKTPSEEIKHAINQTIISVVEN